MPVSSGTCKSSGIYKIATSPMRVINEFSGWRIGGVQQRAFIWAFRFPSAILRAGVKAGTYCWVRKPERPWLHQTNRLRRPWYVMPRQSFTLVLQANIDHWNKNPMLWRQKLMNYKCNVYSFECFRRCCRHLLKCVFHGHDLVDRNHDHFLGLVTVKCWWT